ncbi:MAG TPA: hypothetical protein VFV67_35525 [Actinophytocola sp.]|uniref:hypothetical protein n=1 Tax=Actinophytocola sp. TaxID=1872138 RepID=UPI002DB71091|nr:hypothetical protein [Actinophytocola sp.]HEU5475967.1 hypothetical protein [Actinophytocola sp.]
MNLSEPALDREAADRALQRLGADSDNIAEGLVAMDSHPGHQLLRAATLTGLTRTRWAQASTAMATLWDQFAAYRALLDRARAVRARRARPGQAELDELAELLTGKVVELNQQQIPIERRSLTGPGLIVERITLTELVARMKSGYATVTALLAEVDAATAEALRRIDTVETELAALAGLAASFGPAPLPELEWIRDELADIRVAVAADPLAGPGDRLAEIEVDLAELRERFAGMADIRDTLDERVARISGVLAEIDGTQASTRTAHADVLAKIADPALPDLADRTTPVRAGLDRVQALRGSADWPRLAAELTALELTATAAAAQARTALGELTGLLDRRAELRGRLDAYRAKAARLGRAEDLPLSALHDAAHRLLYTRPCDLAEATRAVNRYQQAIQEGPR